MGSVVSGVPVAADPDDETNRREVMIAGQLSTDQSQLAERRLTPPHRRRLAPSWAMLPLGKRLTDGMLIAMVLAALLMPVNYRAGTETDHPHAFFQGLIDLATGTPHTHGADALHAHAEEGDRHGGQRQPAAAPSPSPFVAANVPLAAAANGASEGGADQLRDVAVASLSPDLPSVTDLKPVGDTWGTVALLGTVVAGLLAVVSRRREFSTLIDPLRQVCCRVEAPPPRVAPCSIG